MEQKANVFLETEPLGRLMAKYAVPCVISLLVAALYNIVDQIFIANAGYLGSYGNAANTVVFPLTVVALAFAVMIGDGCCAYVSICLGAGEKENARKSIGSAIVLCIALSAVLTVLYLTCADFLLEMFGGRVNEETFRYSQEYLFPIALGVPFYMFGQAMNPIIRSDGSPRFAMVSTLAGALVNIVLDPVFIFVFKLNVAGAAIATVIAQVASFLYTLFILLKKTQVKINFGNYDLKLIGRITVMGLSPFIILATDSVVNICLNSALKNYAGTDANMYLTISTITTSFFQLITMPLMGISSGTQAFISYNYGANNYDRVMRGERNILIFAIIFCAVCFGLSFLITKPFIKIFTSDADITMHTTRSIRIFMYGIIPLAFQYCFVDCLTALAKPKAAAFCSLFRKILIISTTFIIPLMLGVMGCFYAEMISDIISSTVTAIFFIIAFPRILHRKFLKEKRNYKRKKALRAY